MGMTALSNTLPSQSTKRGMPATSPPSALPLPSQAINIPSQSCSRVQKPAHGKDKTQMNGEASLFSFGPASKVPKLTHYGVV